MARHPLAGQPRELSDELWLDFVRDWAVRYGTRPVDDSNLTWMADQRGWFPADFETGDRLRQFRVDVAAVRDRVFECWRVVRSLRDGLGGSWRLKVVAEREWVLSPEQWAAYRRSRAEILTPS